MICSDFFHATSPRFEARSCRGLPLRLSTRWLLFPGSITTNSYFDIDGMTKFRGMEIPEEILPRAEDMRRRTLPG